MLQLVWLGDSWQMWQTIVKRTRTPSSAFFCFKIWQRVLWTISSWLLIGVMSLTVPYSPLDLHRALGRTLSHWITAGIIIYLHRLVIPAAANTFLSLSSSLTSLKGNFFSCSQNFGGQVCALLSKASKLWDEECWKAAIPHFQTRDLLTMDNALFWLVLVIGMA